MVPEDKAHLASPDTERSQAFFWFSPGQQREFAFGDVTVTVRFVGRKGRRARLALELKNVERSDRVALDSTRIVSRHSRAEVNER